jgi:hypothetical protein
VVLACLGLIASVSLAIPQTASTGALIGEALDPTGRGIRVLRSRRRIKMIWQ